jgi:hypothetical protein
MYAGCEMDNFSRLTEQTFCPLTPDGAGFFVVYMFVAKDKYYYEVNWSGELKRVSRLQIWLQRSNNESLKCAKKVLLRICFYKQQKIRLSAAPLLCV